MASPLTALFLMVLALAALAVIVVTTRRRAVVAVNDQMIVPYDHTTVERSTFGPLGAVPQSQMTQAVPGQVTLTSTWTPTWAVFVGVLTMPIGLLLLLFVRQPLTLHVRISPRTTRHSSK